MKDFLPRTHFEEEHEMFRDTVRRFVETEVTPNVDKWHEQSMPDREVFKKAGQLGLIGMSTPEEYGGGGEMDFRYNQILNEELANSDCGSIVVSFGTLNDLVAPYLAKFGSEELKQNYLTKMNAGELIGCLAMTEPGAGSDLAGMRTFAKKDGDHYVLNGSKTFISNGILSDFALVAAVTDPSKGRAGVSMFVVDSDLEGYTKTGPLKKAGLKAQDTAELHFDNVRVPADHLLGEEGAAFGYLRTNLAHERLTLAVGSVATSRRAWTLAYNYALERETFGRPIAQHQVHGHYLADIATRVTALQAFVDSAVMAHNAGKLDEVGASMAKFWTTEEQQDIVTRCLQMFGGYGFMMEYPISTHYLDTKVQTIYGGTNEIMKEIISRRIAKGGYA
ncbi:acyl-CoA dehydrogenase family protein [Corynebacterium sp. TAE3-ERU12]|uniref:acyl-CoA dehydrogenase family protein n=1 Tax=Corynebacterium sp. TAE3-ERU12 TaxID=2849491 RepID=UPI001C476627|nr:acyl-CoA dehydrogenase family protein [Corynebacterium sp. TAE3-ERU12]MBV7295707.1 acyl-CoA dehydrogenase family protein [Corynebacterium sp. TAE3-ERU12]